MSRALFYPFIGQVSASRQSKQEKPIWQRRFWEHLIRDEQDFNNQVDYIRYISVHHGLVLSPKDWQYSSFHRYVQKGIYYAMWGASESIIFDSRIGME